VCSKRACGIQRQNELKPDGRWGLCRDAVRQWQCLPAGMNGLPVPVEVIVEVQFPPTLIVLDKEREIAFSLFIRPRLGLRSVESEKACFPQSRRSIMLVLWCEHENIIDSVDCGHVSKHPHRYDINLRSGAAGHHNSERVSKQGVGGGAERREASQAEMSVNCDQLHSSETRNVLDDVRGRTLYGLPNCQAISNPTQDGSRERSRTVLLRRHVRLLAAQVH